MVLQRSKHPTSTLILEEDLEFNRGIVTNIGTGITDIKVGDNIMFRELSGEQLIIGDEKYLALDYEDIIAIL